MDFSDDILGADLEPIYSVYEEDLADHNREHPHRQPLHNPRPRRGGTVPARPAHCLSPVPRAPRRTGSYDRAA